MDLNKILQKVRKMPRAEDVSKLRELSKTLKSPGAALPENIATAAAAGKKAEAIAPAVAEAEKMANVSQEQLWNDPKMRESLAEKWRKQKSETTGVTATAPIEAEKQGLVAKAADLAGAPQRKMLSTIAEKLGRKVSGKDSQEASEAIVEATADALGVPEDSVIGNMAKAAGVAGLEVFADPLAAVPVGKLGKMAGKFAPSIEKTVRKANLDKLMDILKKRKSTAETLVEQGAKVIKPTNIIKSRP